MELSFRTRGEVMVINVSGQIDLDATSRLNDVIINRIWAAPRRLIVDLSEVTLFPQAGASGFVVAARYARHKGVDLILSGAGTDVDFILGNTGFPDLDRVLRHSATFKNDCRREVSWSLAS